MPEDVGATIGVQHHRLYPTSEALMTSDDSSSATILTACSEARIRTVGKSYEKSGSWASESRRGGISKSVNHLMAAGGVRKSRFDTRRDNMLSNLMRKRNEQTNTAPPPSHHRTGAVPSRDASYSTPTPSLTNRHLQGSKYNAYEAPPTKRVQTIPDGFTQSSLSAALPALCPALSSRIPNRETSSGKGVVVSSTRTSSNAATKVTARHGGDLTATDSREQCRGGSNDISTKSKSASVTSKNVSGGAIQRSSKTEASRSSSCCAAAGDSSKQSPGQCDKVGVYDDATRRDVSSSSTGTVAAALAEASRATQNDLFEDPMVMTVGTRVEVYWDGEGTYFPGILTKKSKRSNQGDCFFIEYDDGDREWIHLDREIYRLEESPRTSVQADDNDSTHADIETESSAGMTSRRSILSKKAILTENRRSSSIVLSAKATQASSIVKCTSDGLSRADETHVAEYTRNEIVVKDTDTSIFEPGSTIKRDFGVLFDESIGHANTSSRVSHANVQHDAQILSTVEDDWVLAGLPKRLPGDSSDSETDEEEVMKWASKLFGIAPRPIAKRKEPHRSQRRSPAGCLRESVHLASPFRCALHEDVYIPISEAVKLGRRRRSGSLDVSPPNSSSTHKRPREPTAEEIEEERSKWRKEEAKPLTQAEIKAILSHDLCPEAASAHWVRRSMRQPSRSVLDSPQVKALLDKLRSNDTDMVVLKLKKYVSDPNAPQIVLNAVLDALEENTNCEALYIQNFNEGMRDEQVLRLLSILKRPSCRIWCLNIGETYKVKTKTWKRFADGLVDTNITHMYASEHTITPELKEQIRSTVRDNRGKHNLHCDPENLDTIIQCTHCWWNPFNAKSLRPYLKSKGFDYILKDKDLQGLSGSTSGATLA